MRKRKNKDTVSVATDYVIVSDDEGEKVEKKPEQIIEDTERKEYKHQQSRKITDIRKYTEWYKERFKPKKSVLINMELKNGFHTTFIVTESEDGFVYNKKKYLFDTDLIYFNLDAKLWCYDFHEDISIPLKRNIPVGNIKKAMESSGISEVEYSLNPATLERFQTAKIAEGIMTGQKLYEELTNWLRQMRLMVIIAGLATIIHLLLFMQKTGMFEQISSQLPF